MASKSVAKKATVSKSAARAAADLAREKAERALRARERAAEAERISRKAASEQAPRKTTSERTLRARERAAEAERASRALERTRKKAAAERASRALERARKKAAAERALERTREKAAAERALRARERAAEASLALRRLKEAAARHGLGKIARRLDAKLADVRKWLTEGEIPRSAVKEAITLNVGGGPAITVRGSRIAKLGKIDAGKLGRLTGLPEKRAVREIARGAKKPDAPVRFKRSALLALIERVGVSKAATRLGTTPAKLQASLKPPRTAATSRLAKLIGKYGLGQAASFLGLPEARLEKWLKVGVPRTWEGGLNRAIGVQAVEFPAAVAVSARPTLTEKELARQIAAARRKATAWNQKAPQRFRIGAALIEQWVRLGTFAENFADVKRLAKEQKEPPQPRKKPRPAPPLPPAKPLPTLVPTKPLPVPRPRPPKKVVAPPPEAASAAALQDFLQLRYEHWATGQGTVDRARKRFMNAPWGRAVKAQVADRVGFIMYGKVEQFVHDIDFDRLARKMITEGQRMWAKLPADEGMMTYRLTLAGQGSGNPFYKDAWTPDKNHMEWFRNSSVTITDRREIEHAVRGVLEEVYLISGDMLLFFEHYEIARSTGK